jgi:hypothetical protein
MAVSFPLSVTLMEVFWVFPWLIWLAKLPQLNWAKPPLSLLSLAFILGISFLSTKFFLSRKWPLRWVRLSILACGILTVFTIIRAEYSSNFGLLNGKWFVYVAQLVMDSFPRMEPLVVALVLSICLWWRGINLGRSRLNANDIYRSFLFGIAALVLVIIVGGTTLGAGFLFRFTSIWAQLAGFFFFGLMAMALVNLKTAQQKTSAEGISPTLNRRWLSVLLVIIGGLVTASVGIASIVSVEFVSSLGRILNTASDILFRVLSYLYIPIGYLIEGVNYIGRFIFSLLRSEQPQPFESANVSEILGLPETTVTRGLPPELILALKWLFFTLVAAGLIFLLVKAVFRYMPFREKDEIDEIHESLWSWDLFRADLHLLLHKLQRRFEPKRKSKATSSVLPGWYLDNFLGMLSVRQIYQCLLWEASRINMTRQHCETPNEYARRLGRTVPNSQKFLDEITGLYIEARYGELEIHDRLMVHANNLWKSLRKLLRQLGNEQPI